MRPRRAMRRPPVCAPSRHAPARPSVLNFRVSVTRSKASRKTAGVNHNAQSFTGTLDLYEAVVNSVRYRERGHRDDWLIGDLYVKKQALPQPPPDRIEVTLSHD